MNLRALFIQLSFIGMSFVVNANNQQRLHSNEVLAGLADREHNFSSFVEQDLIPFWQTQVVASSFKNVQDLDIHYVYAKPDNATQAIVIAPGRGEGGEKYQELMYDFYHLGYAVFVIDHQGQGLSSRRLNNPYKGYVEDFEHYVSDFHQFITQVVNITFSGDLFFASHSMGGAIGLRYIQAHPKVFKKAIFSSPMWALRAGPVPKVIAKSLVNVFAWASGVFSDQSPYFLGGKDYNPVSFEDNVLTSSKVRYQRFRDVYRQAPKLQLGSATIDWVKQSIDAFSQAYDELNKVKTPLIVIQSGADQVIDNEGQDRFCQRLKELGNPCATGKPIIIPDAQHELFIEQDSMRTSSLQYIIEFLSIDKPC